MAIDWPKIQEIRDDARILVDMLYDPEVLPWLTCMKDFERIRADLERLAYPERTCKTMTAPEVMEATGITATTLGLRVRRGDFPAPIVTTYPQAWLGREILAWKEDRK